MGYSLRYHASVLLALIAGACAACSTGTPTPVTPEPPQIESDDIQGALDAAITLYRVDEKEGFRNICSGVRVGPTRIVTAYHCVLAAALTTEAMDLLEELDPMLRHVDLHGLVGTEEFFARRISDRAQKAKVLAVDPSHDIAILSTEWSYQPSANLRGVPVAVGEDVFAIGNPLGLKYTFTRGWVSYSCREYKDEPGICWVQSDVAVGPGNSGGGLYDAEGYLIGLCSHGWSDFAFNMFSDPRALKALVDANP